MDDPLLSASKDEVLGEFLPHFTRINSAFDHSWLEKSWMFAASYAQPIVSEDHQDHIQPFDTPLRGSILQYVPGLSARPWAELFG